MNTQAETMTFEEAVALQFDLLRATHETLKECGVDTAADWQKSMEGVLTNYKQRFEINEITEQQYAYIVNFWLDNFLTTTRPLLE